MMVTSKRQLENYIQKEYLVEENVQAFLCGAKVTDTRVMSDGNVEVDMELRLQTPDNEAEMASGEEAVNKADFVPADNLAGVIPQPVPSRKVGWQAADYYDPTRDTYKGENAYSAYTALIVNARNCHLDYADSVELVDFAGNTIFPTMVDLGGSEPTLGHLGVTFSPSIEEAMRYPGAGDRPLIIDALGNSGHQGSKILISDNDLSKIEALGAYRLNCGEIPCLVVVD